MSDFTRSHCIKISFQEDRTCLREKIPYEEETFQSPFEKEQEQEDIFPNLFE